MTSRSLTNKTILITGASAGIGLAAAAALVGQGARVLGVGRSPERCQAAEARLRAACPDARITYIIADLAVQGQVRRLAADVKTLLADEGKLDILVNNAGVYADHYTLTPDGAELTLAVNHFAPFLLTHELLGLLRAAPSGRVLTVSSGSHRNTWIRPARMNQPFLYFGLWAYKVSKLANLLFTVEFNRRQSGTSVRAYAVDPGLVNTDIGLKGTHGLARWVWLRRQKLGAPPERPAKTILHLSSLENAPDPADCYWFDSHPKPPSRAALSERAGRELWAESCKVCGIDERW